MGMEGEGSDTSQSQSQPDEGQPSQSAEPTSTTTATSTATAPPQLPRARVVRPPPAPRPSTPASPPPPPEEIDPEAWDRFKKWQDQVDARMPEIERLRKETERAKREREEFQAKERQYQQELRRAAEHNFGLILEAEAAAVGQAVNLHPESFEDMMYFLDRNCHTDKDADGNPTVIFRDGKVEIDMNDPEWRKKLGQHIVTRKPTWIKSRLSNGGGGAGNPAQTRTQEGPPKTVDDLAARLARGEFNAQLKGIAGGRSASGR